ncbi:MAG: hypothetical protein IFK94_10915 [Acidobacteria bacterium]|uniref:Uncharacterized protein n=1 Tax=Candidatus Polarisedimenticola svalbardensis TaxID=2886004 RepID=A0A8J7CET3_9BACT|nr:hypothetical protein [Candidatus Polarisedimenticola svalbardensis]
MDPSYAPPQEKQGWKGWQKALFGVGIGCSLLFIGTIGACFMGVLWLSSTGDQLPLDSAVGEDSIGVFGSQNRYEDEGVVEMIDFLTAEFQRQMNRMQGQEKPEVFGWIENSPYMQTQRQGQFRQFIPMEVTLTLEPVAGEEEFDWLVAANLRSMPRMLPMMFSFMADKGGTGSDMYKYQGQAIIDDGEGLALCFASGTILVSRTGGAIESFLDRADDAGSDPAVKTDLAADATTLATDWDFYGVVTNENGALVELLRSLDREPGPEWNAVGKIVLGVDIAGSDEIGTEIRLTIKDPEDRKRMADLYIGQEALPEDLSVEGLVTEQTVTMEGEELIVFLNVTGLRTALRSWFDELTEEVRTQVED